ncbi:hypothetical protein TMatcc_007071 [Talaromyces marneffei ATCC 18224]
MAEIASPASPVEARSLSSITSIAANPPAYPRNPTQAKLDRVELYIVKVPGSKDVVLTPLKPPTKSIISIEAINSSLYYLHVATEEDEDLLRSIESEQREHPHDAPAASRLPRETLSRLNDCHRKPVAGQEPTTIPPPPPPPPHREGVSDDQAQSVNDDNTPRIPRKSVHDSCSANTQPKQNPISRDFTIARRPVSSGNATLVTPTSTEPNTGQGFSYDGPPPSIENIRPNQSNVQEHLSPGDILTNQNLGSPFRITLIRRDAASGNQWNVATISSSREDKGIIHAEISNPGYGKFMNNVRLSTNAMGQSATSTAGEGQNAAEVLKLMAQNMMHDEYTSSKIFYRDITPVKHDHQSHSLSEVLFNRHSGSADTPKISQYVSSKVNRGYYSFKSPWGGTCSFVASVNGGSLKCKHLIPGPAMSAEAGVSGSGQNPEVTVSELRYNIPFALEQSFRPSSILNMNGNSNSLGEKGKGKRAALSQLITTNIQKVQQHARSRSQGGAHTPMFSTTRGSGDEQSPASAAPADDEDRLDFSLAREHGGGGMSATMGVWWRSTYQHS